MLYFSLIFSFWFYSCNHIWILLFGSWHGLNKGEAVQKDYITYKQTPVSTESGVIKAAPIWMKCDDPGEAVALPVPHQLAGQLSLM